MKLINKKYYRVKCKNRILIYKYLFLMIFIIAFVCNLQSQTIVNSKHNLSISGPGSVIASEEEQICIFCHTPHNSSPQAQLWNRNAPSSSYSLYNSSTTDATLGQPDGSSLLCLSCHDGTIALGDVLSRTSPIVFNGGVTTIPSGNTNLTLDFSNDHPISFTYNSSLSTTDGELIDPSSLTGEVKLENNKMQCTSCHDPHNNALGNFLVASTENSVLCNYCHDKTYWSASNHKLSTSTWNGSGNNPWSHTDYNTVEKNSCENCHNPHNANGGERLMNYNAEEDNCFDCHNGNVANTDINAEFNKIYKHPVADYNHIHDPNEPNEVVDKHVECQDCHNPHASNDQTATAPFINGSLRGVKGVDSGGNDINPVQYEYEVCYRCHGDTSDKPPSAVSNRQIEQNNVRLEFDTSNPSFHPVEGNGVNSWVPSLIPPLTVTSKIFCSDCHASSGLNTEGPHGSIYPQILKYRYEIADNTNESYSNYRLCYDCHDRNTLLFAGNGVAEKIHDKHVRSEDAPCSACHDSHGISNSQGNSTNNSHLINFDLDIVSPNDDGDLYFRDTGYRRGECYLKCHDKKHEPKDYEY